MSSLSLLLILLASSVLAFELGRRRASVAATPAGGKLHSLPRYHGYFVGLACLVPALAVLCAWSILEPKIIVALLVDQLPPGAAELPASELGLLISSIRNAATGFSILSQDQLALLSESYRQLKSAGRQVAVAAVFATAVVSTAVAFRSIRPDFHARNIVERGVEKLLLATSLVALLATLGILFSVLFEAIRFFQLVSPAEFLLGLEWSPQTAIREDQVASSGQFGIVPLLTGTLLVTVVAMAVAVPIGLLSGVYLAEFSGRRFRQAARPALEILAGVPTVVFGFFAALIVGPAVHSVGESVGLEIASSSALAVGLVIGIMIVPLISSLADDALRAVPSAQREAALALGATRAEVVTGVVIPAALPALAGALLLAISRAIGETMIVLMAAGLAANLTANPFASVTTVTVQIVTILVGDQAFDSARTLSAFALGFVLFVLTLVLNVVGLRFVASYRSRYE